MSQQDKKPEVIVFASPNGSGKTTVTKLAKVIEPYINADEIKRTNYCTDLEAAQFAEIKREECVEKNVSFTFLSKAEMSEEDIKYNYITPAIEAKRKIDAYEKVT